jgi:hypothetical protein
MHTEDRIAWAPSCPLWLSSNGGEKLSRYLCGINTRHGVTSASVIVSSHVRVPVPVVSDEIPNPIWSARLVDGLAGEGNTQRACAGWNRRLRTVAYMTV